MGMLDEDQDNHSASGSSRARLARIRHFALDLDGTLYLGGRLFDFTRPFLATLRRRGLGRTFFTNNSSRSTRQYVQHLSSLGIDATADDIYSSTHTMLAYLREQRPDVRRLLIVGTGALREEFVEHGFALAGESEDAGDRDAPDAVIVGFDTTLTFARLSRAAYWITRGKPFLATHPDRTCPTDRPAVLPDCGAICAALTSATGRAPDAVLGKPSPRMIEGVLRRHNLRAGDIAVVGDRLYTDIAMARASGAMGILVLTGETTRELALASDQPPDLIVEDIGELSELIEELAPAKAVEVTK
jgi:NagD protein